jgi:hypothetical protein
MNILNCSFQLADGTYNNLVGQVMSVIFLKSSLQFENSALYLVQIS